MATPSLGPGRHTRRVLLRVAVGFVALLLAGVAGLAGWFYFAAKRALPQLDGTIHVTGLHARVAVVRDAHGVPHISAGNLEDLIFAQGYVTAQDRLWEMDMTRRYGAGELSEILGPSYLSVDRRQRILSLRQTAESASAALSAEMRRLGDAYARGVNTYIDSHASTLPLEFRVLGYRPRRWTIEDSLIAGATFSEMLNLGYAYSLVSRERVLARVPPDLGADLFPTTSWRDHPPMQEEPPFEPEPEDQGNPRRLRGRAHRISAADPNLTDILAMAGLENDRFLPGSNNWVISGAHTASGKPLLSNDMHLEHHVPNIWYEVHLTSGDFDVAGVSAPGIPFVIVGHNPHIAWGFTNLNPAATDLYVESFNPAGEYRTPAGWSKPGHRREVIHVNGGSDEALDVVTTRHGPIVTGIIPGESRQLALKWILYAPGALSFLPFYEADAAATWDEFRAAMSHFGSPGQNAVYADADGHIGFQATGWVPVRKSGDGTRPVPGDTDDYEWSGFLSFDQMPRVFDPASGLIATANSRTTPAGYPHLISNEWMAPYRTERIYHVLQSGKQFSPEDMLALQTDIYSDFDRFCAARFVYAIDHSSRAGARVREAADLMRKWDGRVTLDSPAPALVTRSRAQLRALLLAPVLGTSDGPEHGWRQYSWEMSDVWMENLLSRRPARWLPKEFGSWDDLLAAAVQRALDEKDVPRRLQEWTWGKASPLYIQHPIFGRIPVLRRWSGPGERPQSGDSTTVKQVGRSFGPSERMTVNFADLDSSTLNIVTGQSGNLFSPHYMDQFDAWYQGRTFALPFSAEAVRKTRVHELRLEPK